MLNSFEKLVFIIFYFKNKKTARLLNLSNDLDIAKRNKDSKCANKSIYPFKNIPKRIGIELQGMAYWS